MLHATAFMRVWPGPHDIVLYPCMLQQDCEVLIMLLCCAGPSHRLMLGASVEDLQAAKQRVDVLIQHLPGADVAFMVQEDPSLMFEELAPSKHWGLAS